MPAEPGSRPLCSCWAEVSSASVLPSLHPCVYLPQGMLMAEGAAGSYRSLTRNHHQGIHNWAGENTFYGEIVNRPRPQRTGSSAPGEKGEQGDPKEGVWLALASRGGWVRSGTEGGNAMTRGAMEGIHAVLQRHSLSVPKEQTAALHVDIREAS